MGGGALRFGLSVVESFTLFLIIGEITTSQFSGLNEAG